jgi:DUF971 family protein
MTQVVPKLIKLEAGNDTLSVQWSDGHVSVYPYRYLRDHCPCATCGGKPSTAGSSPFPMFGVKALKPGRAELVGRYALQIIWNDGHTTGIYAFDYLRSLCPCGECGQKQELGIRE